MKSILLLALALCLPVSALRADWVIIQKTTAAGQDKEMTIKFKDNMLRNDIGKEMTVLLDTQAGSAQMFMHTQKMTMKIDAAMMQQMGSMAGKLGVGGSTPAAKPVATGEKVKVGAWDTEVYTWTGQLGAGKFYIAKDFPKFADLNVVMDKVAKSMNNPMAAMFPQSSDFPGMVVKSEMTMMGQKTVSELVSAEEKPVSADEFKTPEGYKEMKMPAMPAGK